MFSWLQSLGDFGAGLPWLDADAEGGGGFSNWSSGIGTSQIVYGEGHVIAAVAFQAVCQRGSEYEKQVKRCCITSLTTSPVRAVAIIT